MLLPPSAKSVFPLPHRVTEPTFSLPSVQQLPHSSPVPQGNSSVRNGDDPILLPRPLVLAGADLLHQQEGDQDTLGANPAAQMLSAGRVTLSSQTQMLKSDCRAAATDIARVLGHPLHRTGRARKRGFGLHSIFAKLFASDSS